MRPSIARAGKAGWRLLSSLTARELARRTPGTAAKPGLEALEERTLLSVFGAQPQLVRFSPDGGATPYSTSGPTGTTPAQIRHAYGFDQIFFSGGTVAGDGSGTTIAIVDAYDDPTIANDLHQFDLRFGLPDPTFTKVNQNGGSTPPAANHGWASEIALDVEWAHAIAPGASILLVEANSNSTSDLFAAVRYAAGRTGVVAVSMSWGSGEFGGETGSDSGTFTTPSGHAGVTFVASSGDSGAPDSYPSASPNVLSVGGTTLRLDAAGNILSESGWRGSGGGLSSAEAQPSYQQGLVIHSGSTVISANGRRANPDVSYDSDPATGFPVYDTYNNPVATPWGQWGGTSDAAPQWAALIAIADQGRALGGVASLDGRNDILPRLYQLPGSDFHDIATGTSTGTPNYSAGPGYDLVTGLGTPVANILVPHLIARPPVLAPIPDQAAQAGGSVTVTLSATDPNGLSLTYGATAGSQAYALKQQYGLTGGNPFYNYGGRQDKWMAGANNAWYFILPDGTFYKWDGTLGQATGTLLATLDRAYYANPSLIYNATPTAGVVSVSGNQLTVTPPATFSGKLYVVASASNGFATDYKTFAVTVSIGSNQPPALSPIADATIARNGFYAVTLSATDPDGDPISYAATVFSQAYALKQQYGLFSDGNLYLNYGGRQDKWLQGAGGAWFFLLPDGTLYKWDGTANRATGALYAALDVTYYNDPSLLYNAQPGASTTLSGNHLTVTPTAGFTGALYVTATASDGVGATDSKTFVLTVSGAGNQPPVLSPIPDAAISRGTSYATTLSATDPDGDPITYSATVVSQAYQLRQQYGFFSTGNLYFNYGGQGDEWFQGTGGAWYFILPSGGVYAWDGTPNQATGTLIATLQTAYYNNPSLLYNATVGATASVSGNRLTVTPDATFVGALYVTATASDGLTTDSKTFTLTVS
jgi:hypothetical protein